MRIRLLTVVSAAMLASVCAARWIAAAAEERMPDVPPEIARELVLEVKRLSPAVIGPGEPVDLDIRLVNRSKSKRHSVVKPGDGSEVGWREPYVFYTAQRRSRDKWIEVLPCDYARCGLYDSDWQKDVVELAPNEEIVLKDWLSDAASMFELQEPGDYRLRVHYRYTAGAAGKGKRDEPADVGNMKETPKFELVSDPIEFKLVRPLQLEVKVRGALHAETKTKISQVLDVELTNVSEKPLEVASPTLTADARLMLEMRGEFGGWRPQLSEQKTTYGVKHSLAPGESISALGKGEFANGIDGEWEYPKEGVVEVRAAYYPSTSQASGVLKSPWVKVSIDAKPKE